MTKMKKNIFNNLFLFLSFFFTVRPHEARPLRQHFETNFEISQSQVEIWRMKLRIIVFPANWKYVVNHFSKMVKDIIYKESWRLYNGAFLWDDPDQDQWSEITRIMVDQMNRWIHSGQGFIGSFDLPWSKWSRITDWSWSRSSQRNLRTLNQAQKCFDIVWFGRNQSQQ